MNTHTFKNLLLPLLAAAMAVPAGAETLRLRSGTEVRGEVSSVTGKTVTLKDGKTFPRDEVREILVTEKTADPAQNPAATQADPALLAEGRRLFAAAEELGKKYPGSEALTIIDDAKYAIRADGTYTLTTRFAGQVLSDGYKGYWGKILNSFEDGRSRLKITAATVYTKDGGTYPLDASKITTSKPQAGELFFSGGYTIVQYSLPKVDKGAIIDYTVEEETYNPFKKEFIFPAWGFQSYVPTGETTFAIELPAGTDLHYDARNFSDSFGKAAKPAISEKDGLRTYVWHMENVPPIISEPRMPSFGDVAPGVKAAIFKDWAVVFDWLIPMYEERTKPSAELADFTKKLVKDAKTDEEKTALIYHYVQKDIRYIAVKMGAASGWGGYDANLTWRRKFGCCIDKALLLTTMLKAAGIDSSPILLSTNNQAEHNFTIPDVWFNHAITVVRLDGKNVILDSTGHDSKFPSFSSADHGVKVLDVFARRIIETPVPQPKDNSAFNTYDIVIGADGSAEVKCRYTYTGAHESEWRSYFRSIKVSDQKRIFESWAKEIAPQAEMTSFKVNNTEDLTRDFTMEASYKVPGFLLRQGDLFIAKLPDMEMYPGNFPETALEKRTYPIEYTTSKGSFLNYTITFPDTLEPMSMPEPTALTTPHTFYKAGCERDGGAVECGSTFERGSRLIPVKDYAAYKEFVEKMVSYSRERVIFKMKGGAK